MFYLKTKVAGDIEIYGDEIYTRCVECGKEIQVDEKKLRELMQDENFEFASTSLYCEDCYKKINNKTSLAFEIAREVRENLEISLNFGTLGKPISISDIRFDAIETMVSRTVEAKLSNFNISEVSILDTHQI